MTEREYKAAFTNYHKEVVSFITYLLERDDFFAEDIAADCYLALWENGLPEGYTVRAFLFEKARTKVLGLFQSEKRVSKVRIIKSNTTNDGVKTYLPSSHLPTGYKNHVMSVDESEEWADAMLIKAELVALMAKQVEIMPEGRKEMFDYIFVKQLEYKEIADITGLSINTIRVQKSRIIQGFKKIGVEIESKPYWYYHTEWGTPSPGKKLKERMKLYRTKMNSTSPQ